MNKIQQNIRTENLTTRQLYLLHLKTHFEAWCCHWTGKTIDIDADLNEPFKLDDQVNLELSKGNQSILTLNFSLRSLTRLITGSDMLANEDFAYSIIKKTLHDLVERLGFSANQELSIDLVDKQNKNLSNASFSVESADTVLTIDFYAESYACFIETLLYNPEKITANEFVTQPHNLANHQMVSNNITLLAAN